MDPFELKPGTKLVSTNFEELYWVTVRCLQDWVERSERDSGLFLNQDNKVDFYKRQVSRTQAKFGAAIFAALTLESYINFVGKFTRLQRLKEMESLQPHIKYYTYPLIAGSSPLPEHVISGVHQLSKFRNEIVHPKPKEQTFGQEKSNKEKAKKQIKIVYPRCSGTILKKVNNALFETKRSLGSRIPELPDLFDSNELGVDNQETLDGRKFHL